MNIEDLEKALNQVEKQLSELLSKKQPYEHTLEKITEEYNRTDKEFVKQLEEIHTKRQENYNGFVQEKSFVQNKLWEVQAEAGKLETAMKDLQKQHSEALQDLAAQERLEAIWNKIKDFFEDSPWSACIKPFQKEDVLAIVHAYEEEKRGILNANVMGAGKTFEVGAAYDILKTLFYNEHDRLPSTIWLTRKSLMKSTALELKQWNPNRQFIPIEGNPSTRNGMLEIAVRGNIPVIVNYEFLNSTPKVHDYTWDFVFFDECHKLKGGTDVKVFEHTKNLTENSRFFVGLSGSPIQNKPEDIWPIFNILNENRFPSVRRFQREFTREDYDIDKGAFITKVDEERLLNVMRGQVIKQDPKLIQSAWPDKRRIFEVVEMLPKQREVYDKCKQGIISHFAKEAESEPNKVISITAIIAQLTYLRQINVWPAGVTVQSPNGEAAWNVNVNESAKIDRAVELLEDLISEGEQVVVWTAQFNTPLFEIERRLLEEFPELRVAVMTGKTPDIDRQGNEEKFQQGKIDILLCNRGAFSEGFNFQKNPDRWPGGASKAIFLDAWWNPKANEQAEDRIWRTGQSDNVDIYYIYTDDSVDAFIAAKLDEKEAMIKGIMDSDTLRPGDVVGMLEDLL